MPTKNRKFFSGLSAISFWREARPEQRIPKAIQLNGFDESWYLQRYPDVSEAVRIGQVASAREHYIRYGYIEGRLASFAMEADRQRRAEDGPTLPDFKLQDQEAAEVSPCIEFAAGAGDLFVVSGIAGDFKAEPPQFYGGDKGLRPAAYALHVRPDLPQNARGFVAIFEIPDGIRPDAVRFSSSGVENPVLNLDLPLSEFDAFCWRAPSEVLFDLAILHDEINFDRESMATIAKHLRSQVRSMPTFLETRVFATSLDSAWIASDVAPCLLATGWMLEAENSPKITAHIFALTDRLSRLTLLENLMSRPDLEGYMLRYDVPGSAGFVAIGSSPETSKAEVSSILWLGKDSEGRLVALAKQTSPIKSTALFDHALDAISKSSKASGDRAQLINLFGSLFPAPRAEIRLNEQKAKLRSRSGESPACHLCLDLRSENTELHSVIEELVQDRFSRVFITALDDRKDGSVNTALQILGSRNPALDLKIKIVGDERLLLSRRPSIGAGDLVVMGRPYDILQFDVSDRAIDQALEDRRSTIRKSYGYVHDGLSETVRRRGDENVGVLETLRFRLFDPAAGFAAVLPGVHFQLLNLEHPPLACAINEIKAFLLVLEKMGASTMSFGSERLYYATGTITRRNRLDAATIARLDFARVRARLAREKVGAWVPG